MRLLAPLVALTLLAACGQAGDLYLPDPKSAPAPPTEDDVPPDTPEPEHRKPDRPQGG